ncbi:hypothetical protein AJ79_03957 [Helicocarpus griseus UAMH5409]|uniref:PhoD-like phosphatase metallophosphatase domain-containing protein n=1 Tax=Helicocarpus griseus UAMH5409 TaxID=1447875 RepID=A0A2B7XMI2_9EURO|nr:hypothetical protein AJ79_03957 [Helicocarpus griseus UAMH5409]
MPHFQTFVAAISSAVIPGHHAPPLIFSSLLVYLTTVFAIVTSPSFKQTQQKDGRPGNSSGDVKGAKGSSELIAKAGKSKAASGRSPLSVLLTGIPSSRSKGASLATVGINILLALCSLDLLLRGHFLYPTDDLAFSRVGYVSPTTANILIREPDSTKLPIHISYQEIKGGQEAEPLEAGIIYSLNEDRDYTYPVTLTGLHPSTEYRYSFSNKQSGEFTTAPAAGSDAANRLTFLSSSCIKPNFPYNPFNHPLRIRGLELLSTIISKLPTLSRPSFMLFLGDFIYIDVPHRWGSSVSEYRNEYRRVYSSPSWYTGPEPAINIPWLHTLDDHEIANDWHLGNTTAPYPAAVDPYRHYHMSINPPIPDTPFAIPSNTTYFSFTNGPATFFMLDTRTYRSTPLHENSTMLGSAQLDSLLNFISHPEPAGVRWKIVTSSVPFTKNWRVGTEDTWGGFLVERRRIFEAIWRAERELGIRVVLLSGDRHEFGATRFPDPEALTASGDEEEEEEEEKSVSAGAGTGIHEFCTGPLSMFYIPANSYRQTDDEDVVIKYLPTGNVKAGIIHIDADGAGNSVLRYCLYVDEELVWEYRLVTPLVWEEEGRRGLPAGEMLLDRTAEFSAFEEVKRILGEVEGWARPGVQRVVDTVKERMLGLLTKEVGPEV